MYKHRLAIPNEISTPWCAAFMDTLWRICVLRKHFMHCHAFIQDIDLVKPDIISIWTWENLSVTPGIVLWMRAANEWRRYVVTSSLNGWVHSQNNPCDTPYPQCQYGYCLYYLMFISTISFTNCILYYQILQKFDVHWHGGGPSIAMVYHLRRVSDLLYDWKSCLLCYMKDVELHCFHIL